MEKASQKLQNALDECRILVLGMQVLTGFAFQSFLRPGFEHLPRTVQLWKLGSLGLVIFAMVLTMAPCAHHRIVERGRDTRRMIRFTTGVVAAVLVPFALALGVEVFAAVGVALSRTTAIASGVGISLAALGGWYGPALFRERVAGDDESEDEVGEKPKLSEQVRQVMTELRVVLPGAQALLGFQLAGVLQQAFEKLPFSSRCVHLASLGFVALATILLIVPAAYHRLALRGRETERLVKLSAVLLLCAQGALALGVAGDVYVTAVHVLHSTRAGIIAGGAAAFCAIALWFGWALLRRASTHNEEIDTAAQPTG